MPAPVIFITRPHADAVALAERLKSYTPIVAPMLDIHFLPEQGFSSQGVQALICTSRYGVLALARAAGHRRMPLYAVGPATAAVAHDQGFTHVIEGRGTALALAEQIQQECDSSQGKLIHVTGQHTAQDMAELLTSAGFTVERRILYEARPVETFPAEAVRALRAHSSGVALFFSPRSAAVFMDHLRREGLEDRCQNLQAVCLSTPVAAACLARPLPWKNVWISPFPTRESLLGIVNCLFG